MTSMPLGISLTDMELVTMLTSYEGIRPDVRAEVIPHIQLLQTAQQSFRWKPQMLGTTSLDGERRYNELYEDIVQHEELWFTEIFKVDGNHIWCEYTCGVLGTLATILRQRQNLDECQRVMIMYTKVIKRYQEMSEHATDPRQVQCCRGLTYKYNLIRRNLYTQMGQKDKAVEALRQLVQYELEERFSFEDQCAAYLLPQLFERDYDTQLEDTTDDQIWEALCFERSFSMAERGPKPELKYRHCKNCKKREEMLGDFKVCARCNKAPYCSRNCQKAHWKEHKKKCNAKKTTK